MRYIAMLGTFFRKWCWVMGYRSKYIMFHISKAYGNGMFSSAYEQTNYQKMEFGEREKEYQIS